MELAAAAASAVRLGSWFLLKWADHHLARGTAGCPVAQRQPLPSGTLFVWPWALRP